MTASLSRAGAPKTRLTPAKILSTALPWIVIGGLLWMWEFLIGDSLAFVLPRPSLIVRQIFLVFPLLARNMGSTISNAVFGFAAGSAFGLACAVAFVYNATFAKTVYPHTLILRSLPLMALLPILNGILGTGAASKITIVALASFFPVLVNAVQGLTSVSTSTVELMHSLNASKRDIFWKVRLPSSLPYLFTGLKISASGAILAAIISEYMYAVKGIGALIVTFMFGARVLELWAAMIVSAMLSILFYWVIRIIERLCIPWGKSVRES
ncbi:MAG: ABC transporter permease [Spirochaetales bacterium]